MILTNANGYQFEITFSTDIEGDTVEFRDVKNGGQFVSAYYAKTILASSGGLRLDTGAPEWEVDTLPMNQLRRHLSSTLNVRTAVDKEWNEVTASRS